MSATAYPDHLHWSTTTATASGDPARCVDCGTASATGTVYIQADSQTNVWYEPRDMRVPQYQEEAQPEPWHNEPTYEQLNEQWHIMPAGRLTVSSAGTTVTVAGEMTWDTGNDTLWAYGHSNHRLNRHHTESPFEYVNPIPVDRLPLHILKQYLKKIEKSPIYLAGQIEKQRKLIWDEEYKRLNPNALYVDLSYFVPTRECIERFRKVQRIMAKKMPKRFRAEINQVATKFIKMDTEVINGAKEKVKINRRANKLLKEWLSPAEYNYLMEEGQLELPSQYEKNVIYIVRKDPNQTVGIGRKKKLIPILSGETIVEKEACMHIDGSYPTGDRLLANIMVLKTDEQYFKKNSNITVVDQQGRQRQLGWFYFHIEGNNEVCEMQRADHPRDGWGMAWHHPNQNGVTWRTSYITTVRNNGISDKTREYYVWAYDTDEAIDYARLLDRLAIRLPILSQVIFREQAPERPRSHVEGQVVYARVR